MIFPFLPRPFPGNLRPSTCYRGGRKKKKRVKGGKSGALEKRASEKEIPLLWKNTKVEKPKIKPGEFIPMGGVGGGDARSEDRLTFNHPQTCEEGLSRMTSDYWGTMGFPLTFQHSTTLRPSVRP